MAWVNVRSTRRRIQAPKRGIAAAIKFISSQDAGAPLLQPRESTTDCADFTDQKNVTGASIA
jgi:hypothetical protein